MRSLVSAKGERDMGTSMVFLSALPPSPSGTESMRRNMGRSTLSGALSADCWSGDVVAPGILRDLVVVVVVVVSGCDLREDKTFCYVWWMRYEV